MLLAQLERKVPSEFEGMEDVLTSSVFGLLKYLPDQLACELLAECAAIPLPQGPLQLKLWHRYPTPPGFRSPAVTADREEESAIRGATEPDAVIETGDWLVLMEAKYRSPLDTTYDQLGREFAVGYRLAQNAKRRFRLLVITGHTFPPTPAGFDLETGVRNALAAASAGLGDAAAEMITAVPTSLHWTNWQQLYSIMLRACDHQDISGSTRRLLEDVCRLLELRGLKPYDNRPIANVLDRCDRAGIPDDAWSLPVAYRYRLVSSLGAGWEQLLRLDTTTLHPLGWQLQVPSSKYDPVTHLGHFQLGSLRTPVWQPFACGGQYENRR
jgi:hypothetical protein